MLPDDWAYECWGFITFSTRTKSHASVWRARWEESPDEVEAQNQILRTTVAPLLSDRRWFFRRAALAQDLPGRQDMAAAYLAVYVRLDPRCANPEQDLRELRSRLRRKRRDVAVIRCWDRCFGPESTYGPPKAQAALRHCCCEVTRAFIYEGEPLDVAARWIAHGGAQLDAVAKWTALIVGEPHGPVANELDRRLSACRAT